jgi:hemerythrin-like metal-binding protein
VPPIFWQDSYSVGLESIDNQHRRLFDLVNTILETRQGLANPANEGEIMQSLLSYVREHLKFEEELMAESGYPDLAAHAEQHYHFVISVIEKMKLALNGRLPYKELAEMLGNWLTTHVMGVDQKYAPWLTRRGNGSP